MERSSFVQVFSPYVTLSVLLIFIASAGISLKDDLALDANKIDIQLILLSGVVFFCYIINRISSKTFIPVYVWALLFGFALQPLLGAGWQSLSVLKLIAEIAAAIILFTSGLETPFKQLRHLFVPVASLSLASVLVSTVAFSLVLYFIASYFGFSETNFITSLVITSAILVSADPAATIPILRQLHFRKRQLRQIATSESTLTDVSGSLVTRILLLAAVPICAVNRDSVFAYFVPLLSDKTLLTFIVQVIVGLAVGFFGFLLLKKLYSSDIDEREVEDPALLIGLPVLIYALANILGGAGFLAVFVSGLFLDIFGKLKASYVFYDKLLNLIRPFVFVVLGLIVPVKTLIYLAPIGIWSAIIFIFFIRPIVVSASFLPWVVSGKLSWRENFFLSLTREAGVVAAVLLIIASGYEIISSSYALAVGVWIIFISLLIELPLIPKLAEHLGVSMKHEA